MPRCRGAGRGLRLRPGIELDSKTGLNLVFLALNNDHPPFTDRRVRRAIAHAIDRRGIITSVLGGHGEPARNPLPPSIWATPPARRSRDTTRRRRAVCSRRPAWRAASRRSCSRTPHPGPTCTSRWPSPCASATISPGSESVPGSRRSTAGRTTVRAVAAGTSRWPCSAGRPIRTDPNDFLTALLGSASIGGSNRCRYRSAPMDRLLKRGQTSTEPEARRAAYRQAQELFQEDMPMIPLYHASIFTASRASVNGLQISPTGLLRYDKVWKAEHP